MNENSPLSEHIVVENDLLEHKLKKRKHDIQIILSINRNINSLTLTNYIFILKHFFSIIQTSTLASIFNRILNKLQTLQIPFSQQEILKTQVHNCLHILNNKSSLSNKDEELIFILLHMCHYLYIHNIDEFYSCFYYSHIEKTKIFIKQLLNETEYSVSVQKNYKMILITTNKFKENLNEFLNVFKDDNYKFLIWMNKQLSERTHNQIKIHYCIWSLIYNIIFKIANIDIIKCLLNSYVFNNLLFIFENYTVQEHTIIFTISIKCLLIIKEKIFMFNLLNDKDIANYLNTIFIKLKHQLLFLTHNLILLNLFKDLIQPI